jgi:ABC-type antimicrobial peptide transport system permease subunit
MIKDYFVLAIKSLKHRGLRSWLTLLGIIIGVAVVVSLVFLGNGLKLAVMNQFGMSSSEIISVQAGGLSSYGPPGSGVIKPLVENDLNEISRLSSVKRTIRRNIGSGQMEFEREKENVFITNINLEERRFMYEFLDLEMEKGRFFEGGDTKKVV